MKPNYDSQPIRLDVLDLEHADVWLLRRHWRGEASLQEIAQVESWLAEHPDRHEVYAAVRLAADDSDSARTSEADWAARANTIVAMATEHDAASVPDMRHRREESQLPRRWAFLTTVGLVLSLAAGWMMHAYRVNTKLSAQHYSYTTGNGEQATVRLPDGTIVLLNVASRLDIPSDFANGRRTVQLTGEAIFTVTHHQNAPFTVTAGSSTTRVLGTSFVVRRYPGDTATFIAVRDGKINTTSKINTASAVLSANQEVLVFPTGVSPVQASDATRFSIESGILTVARMPFSRAIAELNRWYDVDIRIADLALRTVPIEGQFGKGSQSDLVNQLSLGLHANVVREGRVLTVYSRGATQ